MAHSCGAWQPHADSGARARSRGRRRLQARRGCQPCQRRSVMASCVMPTLSSKLGCLAQLRPVCCKRFLFGTCGGSAEARARRGCPECERARALLGPALPHHCLALPKHSNQPKPCLPHRPRLSQTAQLGAHADVTYDVMTTPRWHGCEALYSLAKDVCNVFDKPPHLPLGSQQCQVCIVLRTPQHKRNCVVSMPGPKTSQHTRCIWM